jgi:membrane protease YdiL (CAAX protease family)
MVDVRRASDPQGIAMNLHNATVPSGFFQLRLLVRLWWLRQRRRAPRVSGAPQLSRFPTFMFIVLVAALNLAQVVWSYTDRDVKRTVASLAVHALGALAFGVGFGMFKAAAFAGRTLRGDDLLGTLPLKLGPRLAFQLADTLAVLPGVLAIVAGAMTARGGVGLASIGPLCLAIAVFLTSSVTGYAGMTWVRVLGQPVLTRWAHYAAIGWMFVGAAAVLLPVGVWLAAHPQQFTSRVAALCMGSTAHLAMSFVGCAGLMTVALSAVWLAERIGLDRLDWVPPAAQPSARSLDPRALARSMLWRQGGRELRVLLGIGVVATAVWLVVDPEAWRSTGAVLLVSRLLFVFGTIQLMVLASRSAHADHLARPLLCALPLSPEQWLSERFSVLRHSLRPTWWLLVIVAAASLVHSSEVTYRIVVSALALVMALPGMVSVAYLASDPAPDSSRSANKVLAMQLLLMPLFATMLEPSAVAATLALAALAAVSWEARRSASVMLRFWDDPADDIERETAVWRALLALGAFFALQSYSSQTASLLGLAPGYAFAFTFLPAAALLGSLTASAPVRASLWPRARGAGISLLSTAAGVALGLLVLQLARFAPAVVTFSRPRYSGGEWVAVGLSALMVAPVVEEAFFRGWLQRALELQLTAAYASWAFAIAAGAFALAHVGGYGFPQLILGLFCGALFKRSRALLPSILGHAAYNLVIMIASA